MGSTSGFSSRIQPSTCFIRGCETCCSAKGNSLQGRGFLDSSGSMRLWMLLSTRWIGWLLKLRNCLRSWSKPQSVIGGAAHERQTRRPRHLDHRPSTRQPPRSIDRIAEWSSDRRAPVRPTKGIKRSFAAIGERLAHDLMPLGTGRHRCPELGGGEGSAELVGAGEYVHRPHGALDPVCGRARA